jgi:hypothetical protein
METYSTASRAYLTRALQRLKGGTTEGLFYAAFELRCGVEARLQEYLHPHEFIPLSQRTEWRTGKLHRTAEQNFLIGDKVQRVRIYEGDTHLATLFYVPVTSRLKTITERLGDYLHALKQYHPPSDAYWGTFRALLAEGAALLEEATAGTLLGPVLIDKSTGLAQMPTELLPDDHSSPHPLLSLKGKAVALEITYHESLAAAKA